MSKQRGFGAIGVIIAVFVFFSLLLIIPYFIRTTQISNIEKQINSLDIIPTSSNINKECRDNLMVETSGSCRYEFDSDYTQVLNKLSQNGFKVTEDSSKYTSTIYLVGGNPKLKITFAGKINNKHMVITVMKAEK